MSNELFDNNINLVKAIVNRMNYGYVDKEDLMQAGLMGLFYATRNYNSNLNTSFSTFATTYIIGEIKKELRENKLIKLSKDIIRIIKKLKEEENISIDEAAFKLNTTKENIIIALNYKDSNISLNQEREDLELVDLVEEENRIDKFKHVIQELDNDMSEVIVLKYFKGYSQMEIAKKTGRTQSKISRMEKEAIKRMRKILAMRIS